MPVSVSATCADQIASAPAGEEVWNADLAVGGLSLLGPVAADWAGSTYYLAAESALYVKTVYALDACGALRWQSDVSQLIAGSGYVPQVMLAGGYLNVIGIGNIVALDLDTGKMAFVADLTSFAESGGLGEAPGKVQALGYTAAQAYGPLFTAVANDSDVWIVSVSTKGEMHPVAKVENYVSSIGYPLGAQQMALDFAGHIVLAGGVSSGNGEPIHSFEKNGKSVFSTLLPSFGIGQELAAGPDYITGRDLWILNLDGTLRNKDPSAGPVYTSWDGPTAIDAQGNLYVVGGQQEPGTSTLTYNLLGRFSPDGTKQGSTTLDEPIWSGPVLDDSGHVFVTTSAGTEPGSSMHLVALSVDGTKAWEKSLPPSGKTPSYWLLPHAAGALTIAIDGRVHAYSSGGGKPARCAYWPTPRGDITQRVGALGK